MFKQFPPNKNKYPEILEYPYFWDTPRKSKDQTLSIGSRESLHGSSERPFFIWSWTFRDHICMYITVYTSIYSITSIIYIIYKAIDIVMIYTYIYKIHIYIYILLYIICNLYILCCPHHWALKRSLEASNSSASKFSKVFFGRREGLCLFPRETNIVIYVYVFICFYMSLFLYCHRAQKFIYSYQVYIYIYIYMCVFKCCFHTVNSIQNWDR